MIVCATCEKEKDEEEFHLLKSTKTGRHPRCKTCRKVGDTPQAANKRKKRSIVSACEELIRGNLIADNPRTFHYLIKLILESQLLLMYLGRVQTPTGRMRVRNIISDSMAEIGQALSRTSSRVRGYVKTEEELLEIVDHARLDALRLLGVTEASTPSEIRLAYYAKVREAHPDLRHNETNGEDEERNNLMQLLNDAYETLTKEPGGGDQSEEA